MVQTLEGVPYVMRIVRLPGIHHDANAVLLMDSEEAILIDSGTAWYQLLQQERIVGQLGEDLNLREIVLTSRRYPFSGGSASISERFENVPIKAHASAISSLTSGDFFTTWANRYDSDMPRTSTHGLSEGDVFPLGEGEVVVVHLPGHTNDGLGFHLPNLSTLVVGALLPRADRPTRWDLPGGSLLDVVKSLKRIRRMKLSSLVPLQGPAIRGTDHVKDVLDRHLRFYEEAVQNDGRPPTSWERPASTAVWLTPRTPWPLEEQESV